MLAFVGLSLEPSPVRVRPATAMAFETASLTTSDVLIATFTIVSGADDAASRSVDGADRTIPGARSAARFATPGAWATACLATSGAFLAAEATIPDPFDAMSLAIPGAFEAMSLAIPGAFEAASMAAFGAFFAADTSVPAPPAPSFARSFIPNLPHRIRSRERASFDPEPKA